MKHIQRIQTVYRYLPKLPGGDILPTITDALYSDAVHPICVPIRAIHKKKYVEQCKMNSA